MSDMDLAQAERTDLVDFLECLVDGQWDAPSLGTEGWCEPTRSGSTPRKGATAAELLSSLRVHARPSGLAAGLGGMIHHRDIDRPLGMERQIPGERLLRVPATPRATRGSRPGDGSAACGWRPLTWTGPTARGRRFPVPERRWPW